MLTNLLSMTESPKGIICYTQPLGQCSATRSWLDIIRGHENILKTCFAKVRLPAGHDIVMDCNDPESVFQGINYHVKTYTVEDIKSDDGIQCSSGMLPKTGKRHELGKT